MVQLSRFGDAQAGAALRRAAAAGRARARARQPAEGAAARRAAGRARPEAPPGDADRAEGDPAGGRAHVHLRDARPGGGAHDERPPRGVQPRRGSSRSARRPRSTNGRRPGSSPASSGCRTCWRARRPRRSRATRTPFTIRPEKIEMVEPDDDGRAPDECTATGHVREVVYLGAVTRYIVSVGRGGRAGGDAAEPHDVVDGGAAGARQGRAPGVGSKEQPPGRGGRGARGVHGPDEEGDV